MNVRLPMSRSADSLVRQRWSCPSCGHGCPRSKRSRARFAALGLWNLSSHSGASNTPARPRPRRGGEEGFAVLVIFILLSIMVIFVTSNALVLRHLHQEIRLVEKRQLKKFEAAPANSLVQTNAPGTLPEKSPE